MPNPTDSTRCRPRLTRPSLLIAGIAVALAACGGSDGDSDDSAGSTEAPAVSAAAPAESAPASTDTAATTAPVDTPTTEASPPTTDAESGGPLSLDELRTILPTAAEVGAGFEVDESPTEVAEDARIFDEDSLVACPGLAKLLLAPDEPTTESADVRFSDTASTRVVDVQIAPDSADPAAAQAEIDELVASIELCPLIIGDVAGIGIYTAFPAIEHLAGPGDQAYRFTLDGDLVNEAMIISLDFRITFWARDGVSVVVAATSGLDDTFEPVPNDDAALDALVATVDARLVDLQS